MSFEVWATIAFYVEMLLGMTSSSLPHTPRPSTPNPQAHLIATHLDLSQVLATPETQVNAADESATQPLHWAAQRNHTEILEKLMAAGGNIEVACLQASVIRLRKVPIIWVLGPLGYAGVGGQTLEGVRHRIRIALYEWFNRIASGKGVGSF